MDVTIRLENLIYTSFGITLEQHANTVHTDQEFLRIWQYEYRFDNLQVKSRGILVVVNSFELKRHSDGCCATNELLSLSRPQRRFMLK